jgi:hypothetical protein
MGFWTNPGEQTIMLSDDWPENIRKTKNGNKGVSMRNVARIRYVLFAALFTGLLFTGGPAWAGGFYINEYGTPSSGTAQAGAEAVARDASTVWHNPAGMTRVEGSNLLLGAGTMFVNGPRGRRLFYPCTERQALGGHQPGRHNRRLHGV